MSNRMLAGAAIGALITLAAGPAAHAEIVAHLTTDDWIDAVGPGYRFIDFTGLEVFEELPRDEYADVGVRFIGPPESTLIFAMDSDNFLDGEGISSYTEMLIRFDEPANAIGFQLPASFARVDFLDGEGSVIDDAGTIGGPFLGITTSFEFHAVKLLVNIDTTVSIDDLYVGPPIPAPAGLGLLALAGAASRRRPRS